MRFNAQAQEAFEGMQEGASEGEAISFALDNGIFTPEESPAQKMRFVKTRNSFGAD